MPYLPVTKDYYTRLLMTQQIETRMKVMSNQIWFLIPRTIRPLTMRPLESQIAVLAQGDWRVALSRGVMDGLEFIIYRGT